MKKTYLLILMLVSVLVAQKYSVVGLADPRDGHGDFEKALNEVKNHKALGNVAQAKIIFVAGDIDPFDKNMDKYKSVFSSSGPLIIPVMGNHDGGDRNKISSHINSLPGVERGAANNFYVDVENTRAIAADAYKETGGSGCLNGKGIDWVNQAIASAPSSIQHIFIGLHDPPFPRKRHTGDSFNDCPGDRDKFWNMLISHSPLVKAVFVGHTHYYSRLRVKDPKSSDADNTSKYPDQKDGIYQIDAGGCGNGKDGITVVNIEIDGGSLNAKAVRAGGNVVDEFAMDFGPVSPLSVSITSPQNNAVFDAPANVTVNVAAAHAEGGTVNKVELRQGGQLVGTDDSSPFSINLTGLAIGNYELEARAYSGDLTANSSVAIRVKDPNMVNIEAESCQITNGNAKPDGSASGGNYADFGEGGILSCQTSALSGTYSVSLRIQVPRESSRSMGVFVNGTKVGVATTSALLNWTTVTLSDVVIPAGNVTIEVRDSEGTSELDIDNLEFSLTGVVDLQEGVKMSSDLGLRSFTEENIEFILPRKGEYTLSVYSVGGVPMTFTGTGSAGRNKVSADMALPQGIYFLRLEADGRTVTRAFSLIRMMQ